MSRNQAASCARGFMLHHAPVRTTRTCGHRLWRQQSRRRVALSIKSSARGVFPGGSPQGDDQGGRPSPARCVGSLKHAHGDGRSRLGRAVTLRSGPHPNKQWRGLGRCACHAPMGRILALASDPGPHQLQIRPSTPQITSTPAKHSRTWAKLGRACHQLGSIRAHRGPIWADLYAKQLTHDRKVRPNCPRLLGSLKSSIGLAMNVSEHPCAGLGVGMMANGNFIPGRKSQAESARGAAALCSPSSPVGHLPVCRRPKKMRVPCACLPAARRRKGSSNTDVPRRAHSVGGRCSNAEVSSRKRVVARSRGALAPHSLGACCRFASRFVAHCNRMQHERMQVAHLLVVQSAAGQTNWEYRQRQRYDSQVLLRMAVSLDGN